MTDTTQFRRTKMSRAGLTAVLTLASDKVNALDSEVLGEIASFVELCEQDPEICALVVTGEGPVFSAGLNVSEVLDNEKSRTDVLLDALVVALVRLFRCPKPTVAAINGSAIAGGCILACACDKRFIAEGARIGVTELRVGVSFPTVAVELLRHVCGDRAEPLMLDAELLDPDEACRRGLVHQSYPLPDLLSASISAAEQLALLDAGAYALAKASSRQQALRAIEGDDGRRIDQQVRTQWQDDRTRANLDRIRKPKG
jgi:enoyl-CoA hydratase/carnithine racemase